MYYEKAFALILCLALVMSMAGCVRIVIGGEESSVQVSANGAIGLSVSTQNAPFFVSLVEGAEKQAAAPGVKLTQATLPQSRPPTLRIWSLPVSPF